MRLVLYDIDGTLLSDHGASREAFADALRDVYDFAGDLSRYDFSGRTDPQITHMILRDAGRTPEDIDARIADLWEAYLQGLARNATPRRVQVLPGVHRAVAALAGHPDVVLALLTGNIEPGARLKLEGAALNHYFPFGAFGSDSADRNALPPIAIERAERHSGRRFEAEEVVIIGDSIYDVRCGAAHGTRTIAVASGKTPAHLLRAENPHHFFDSTEELEGLLDAILR